MYDELDMIFVFEKWLVLYYVTAFCIYHCWIHQIDAWES